MKTCQICGEPSEKSICLKCEEQAFQQALFIARKNPMGRKYVLSRLATAKEYGNLPTRPEVTC